jgi:SPP1 gp7 family putative phage head morphogenesis protein
MSKHDLALTAGEQTSDSSVLVFDTRDELEGLTAAEIGAAAAEAVRRGLDGKYALVIDRTTKVAALSGMTSQAARMRVAAAIAGIGAPGQTVRLVDVFSLPPKDAIAFFERKGFKISWDWQEVWRHAHSQAFTVAKVTRLDVLTDIHRALHDDLKNGGSFPGFLDKLQPILEAKGWWGKLEQVNRVTGEIRTTTMGSPWRLETIYETNMQSAYMAGRYAGMMAATQYAPWWEYSATMDSRTRPTHAALNGRVFRFDDPFWDTWYPPNGFRCRCRVIPRTDIEHKRGDFQTSVGAGRMEVTTVTVKKPEGKIAKVQVTGYKDGISGKLLTPDIGFDYNPGAASARLQQLYSDKLQSAPAELRAAAKKHD